MRNRILFILVGIFIAGCGSGSPFKYVKVSGSIRYEDGSPIPPNGIELRFSPLDAPKRENVFPRPAVARINENGEFDCVTSYKYGDGLIPGRHKVAIDLGSAANPKPVVPKEYTSIATTPLEVDTQNAPFEIKVPKPKETGKR